MRYLSIFLTALFLTSCCGTKNTVENTTSKEIAEVISKEKPKPVITNEIEVGAISEPLKPVVESTTPEQISMQDTIKEEPIIEHDTTFESFDHSTWSHLLQKHVTEEGNVNYKGFRNERTALKNYITLLSDNMPVDSWSNEDKLAYWINAYNAMTVDLIVRNYPIKSIKDIKDPWKQRLWKLGSKWYNLDEIEHQILRKMNEPRIHFGIVCASFSCPKLQNEAFTASNLESQLTTATKAFLSDSDRNNISENNIKLSKIFKWFGKDFKQNGSLIDFLNQYSDVTISQSAKKSFKDYNWDLNE